MRRVILIAVIMLAVFQSTAQAQERPPLAMQIEFTWTVIGLVGGAGVGALIWLTDPGNPNTTLAENVALTAAWGTIIGAGIGIFIMQRSAIFPSEFVRVQDPLDPRNRISEDPIRIETGGSLMFAGADRLGGRGNNLTLPLLNLRF